MALVNEPLFWIAVASIVLLIAIVFIIIKFVKSKKEKKEKEIKTSISSNKDIDDLIIDIRKELRNEHKRLTVLFKDLDDFVAQLPPYFNQSSEQ